MTLSYSPREGTATPAPPPTPADAVAEAVTAGAAAAGPAAAHRPGGRAAWLGAIARAVEAHSGELTALADEETALGLPRLAGELAGAARSLRFYGAVATEGSYLGAVIDHASHPDSGIPARPDLRRARAPFGPVAVFGASNFPFGFGVLGHDTASALAAGCPVIVKAHPAHPRLSARLGELAAQALAGAGAPAGTLQVVHGFEAGRQLVTHPGVRAVGFTGSQAGGLALWRLAATRDEVIPVYAEMGTVNTVVVTPDAARERGPQIAAGFVGSFTLGMGQFCTKPGLLLVPAGHGLPEEVARALEAAEPGGWLLTEAIAGAYADGLRRLEEAGAKVMTRTPPAAGGWAASPALLRADSALLTAGSALLAECFGPVALVAEYPSEAALAAVLRELPGSLAAAVHGTDGDPRLPALVAELSQRCGRVVVNGWPTGVAVGWAQQHGGPWPATTAPAYSSVGAAALDRWTRPVAFQDVPDGALPPALRDANPWRLPRRVDGILST
ncbi:MAG TPA: aldehyde dehydrogenase family protein [Trebonia sp.]|jgi:NADP-dependent aldehyde dehydrogenase|nr:aldehyde dehydrogenase family protein [Trebonia sp.]